MSLNECANVLQPPIPIYRWMEDKISFFYIFECFEVQTVKTANSKTS
jgi:hypothetical protein